MPALHDPASSGVGRGVRLLASGLCGLQALVLVTFAGFYLYELAVGGGQDAGRVVMSAVVILVAAVALGVLARGWMRWTRWPRTPTVVWDLLLLPVGWSLYREGQNVLGLFVLAVALLTLVCALRAPTPSQESDPPA